MKRLADAKFRCVVEIGVIGVDIRNWPSLLDAKVAVNFDLAIIQQYHSWAVADILRS